MRKPTVKRGEATCGAGLPAEEAHAVTKCGFESTASELTFCNLMATLFERVSLVTREAKTNILIFVIF